MLIFERIEHVHVQTNEFEWKHIGTLYTSGYSLCGTRNVYTDSSSFAMDDRYIVTGYTFYDYVLVSAEIWYRSYVAVFERNDTIATSTGTSSHDFSEPQLHFVAIFYECDLYIYTAQCRTTLGFGNSVGIYGNYIVVGFGMGNEINYQFIDDLYLMALICKKDNITNIWDRNNPIKLHADIPFEQDNTYTYGESVAIYCMKIEHLLV